MRNKEYWIGWAKAAGVRAVKTVAQSAIATIGTAVVLKDVNWNVLISGAIIAGLLSMLTSVAGIPEVELPKSEEK